MAITERQRQYRRTPEEKARRLAYFREYRQRPEVRQREAERAKRRRAADGGAEANRSRVKSNRAALGRNYITELIRGATGIRCRDVPDDVVKMKREALQLSRMAKQIMVTATEGESNET